MELLRMLLSRWTALFRRRALDEDLEDELLPTAARTARL
ncbi:MAG: hypothetical protein QOJ51_6224 [Acidobacteriaceae bacterium]|jgi:hypothetical protein|nr:hypothetical protein [Acidobacteriaceae bacterium]MDX6459378.1 hypothetical protein [Acidobacteriaceae bacterium]MEA2263399.1 hypothetical protein [Acidobacteriaceae bacterium]